MTPLEIVRAVVGFVLVLFVPGYAATWALFPDDKEIDIIERIALAIGLSIALVVLVIYVLNIAVGVKINMLNSLIVILVITLFCAGVYFMRAKEEVEKLSEEGSENPVRKQKLGSSLLPQPKKYPAQPPLPYVGELLLRQVQTVAP